jgi:hypothetical protein
VAPPDALQRSRGIPGQLHNQAVQVHALNIDLNGMVGDPDGVDPSGAVLVAIHDTVA